VTRPNPLKTVILDPLPTQPNPNQTNPWVNPTHGQLCTKYNKILFFILGCWLLPEKFSLCLKNNGFARVWGLQPPAPWLVRLWLSQAQCEAGKQRGWHTCCLVGESEAVASDQWVSEVINDKVNEHRATCWRHHRNILTAYHQDVTAVQLTTQFTTTT